MKASRRFGLKLFLIPLVLLLACATASAQQNSLISGSVVDSTGAAIPGAALTLTQTSTGFTTQTTSNASGYYTFAGLNPGSYDLTVLAKGFQKSVSKGLVVNVSQTLRVDNTMKIGTEEQTITVAADALVPQVDSNQLSTLISSEQITSIATENRNFSALVALGLGVSSLLPDSNTPTSVGSSASISINGLRQSHNIWLIDGGEADDRGGAGGISIMPSQDAIAEMQVLSSNYPPDYGISSGATVSLSLKSGTRKFNGSAWEENRNTAFNANTVGNKQNNPVTARPKLDYNIYGFNLGGPLFIPKTYNTDRNKTFFFWNEEWRKLIQSSGTNQNKTLDAADFPTAGAALTYVSPKFASTPIVPVVPSAVGDPTLLAKFTADGLTPGSPFPGNVIPANLIDPNAIAYLKSGIVPKPTNTATGYFIGGVSLPINVRDDILRVDHRINDKWQILGHYMHDSVSQSSGAPMIGWSGGTYPTITSVFNNPSNSAAVKVTGAISSNLLVEVSLNYDGNVINIINSALGQTPTGFSTNPFFANGSTAVPAMSWNGPYGTTENPGSAPWHNAANDYSPKVDVSYTSGKHQIKFGGSYNQYVKNQKLFLNAEGGYSFNTLSNDPFVDMMLGLAGNYSQSQAAPIRHYFNQTTSAYLYDTWHVTSRLSLQLGLRYDALPHAWEKSNAIGNFNPNHYLASLAPTWNNGVGGDGSLSSTGPGFQTVNGAAFYMNGVDVAGQNGVPVGLVNNDYKTLQPRVGFSEDLTGDGKTVLRGGFGTFYERLQGNDIYNAATAAPFANTPSANSVYLTNPGTSWVTGGAAAAPTFAQGSTTLAQTYRAPAVAQFSLAVQRQLAPSIIWTVQYVGNIAWHQNIDRNINNYSLNTPLIAPNTNASLGNNFAYYTRANAGDASNKSGTNPGGHSIPVADQLRNFNGFSGINQQENTTNGNYNGFQTAVRAQNRWGLSGEVDYTYSHEIDITSGDLAGVDNPYNLKYDKGSGTYDRRQMLGINYVYKLPIFKSAGLMHNTLGGWEIAGTFIDQTGVPVKPGMSMNFDPIGLGGGYSNLPNVTGKRAHTGSGKGTSTLFNTSGWSHPTAVWAGGANQGFGSSRKDAIVGPGRVNFTTAISKTFVIHEGYSFQFRAETFNTFNHTEGSGVDSNMDDSNFGKLNGYQDPRNVEFGGKLNF